MVQSKLKYSYKTTATTQHSQSFPTVLLENSVWTYAEGNDLHLIPGNVKCLGHYPCSTTNKALVNSFGVTSDLLCSSKNGQRTGFPFSAKTSGNQRQERTTISFNLLHSPSSWFGKSLFMGDNNNNKKKQLVERFFFLNECFRHKRLKTSNKWFIFAKTNYKT